MGQRTSGRAAAGGPAGRNHERNGEFQGIDAGAGDALQGRRLRRGRIPQARELADRVRSARPGPGGHHRREPDPVARRTSQGGRDLHRRGARPRAGDRRRRLQQYARGGRTGCSRRKGWRFGRADRDALLQQAEPGRAVPALQGDRRRHRHSDRHLQHPAALGDRHVRRHDEALLRTEERDRREGRDRQSRPHLAAAAGDGTGFRAAFGRRHHGAVMPRRRRARLHFRRRERRAARRRARRRT